MDVLALICDLNDWKELGLQLGLLYPTLIDIETYRRGKPSDCRIDMLSAWLQQQDNVSKRGVPSWSVLKAALKSMGELPTAADTQLPTAAAGVSGDLNRILSELQ